MRTKGFPGGSVRTIVVSVKLFASVLQFEESERTISYVPAGRSSLKNVVPVIVSVGSPPIKLYK